MLARILALGQGARFTDHVQPACLPLESSDAHGKYNVGVYGVVSGWGFTTEKARQVSKTLQFVSGIITTSDYTFLYFIKRPVTELNFICIYSLTFLV